MEDKLTHQKKSVEEFDDKLTRILADIENKKKTELVDILTAILLSLATVGSAWCAYQSNLWNGIQTFKLMDAHQAGRVSSQYELEANQTRSMDIVMLMQYVNAKQKGDRELAEFYFSRFNSNLKSATLEWLKLEPFINENAPNSPLKMESYRLPEKQKSSEEMDRYYKEMESANTANSNSDTYIMLTVIFAAVLFFGGIASTLQSNLMRNVCLIISAIILLSTVLLLIGMPVAKLFE